jgi:hypothetical protein
MRAPSSVRPAASERAPRAGDVLAPRHTDWLRHDLVVTGPAADVAAFRAAAEGAGAVPWHDPDLDLDEEDRVHALVHPPDGSPGLRLAAARVLARQLRSAIEGHQARVTEAVGRSRLCPFDLHALLPVPEPVLRRGPDDPVSTAWLRAHWGVIRALRHVRLRADAPDRRLRRSARLRYEFWSADWTPWTALVAIRTRWASLVFDVRPDYGDG